MNRAYCAILVSLTFIGLILPQVMAQQANAAEPDSAVEEPVDASTETAPVEAPSGPEDTNWAFIISVTIGSIGLILFIVVEVYRAKWKAETPEDDEEEEDEEVDVDEGMVDEEMEGELEEEMEEESEFEMEGESEFEMEEESEFEME